MNDRKKNVASMPLNPSKTLPNTKSAVESLLREARRLHRAAKMGSISSALPALRRLHAAGVCPGSSVSMLYKERQTLQRKHFLRTLAVEAGYSCWEKYRPLLQTLPEDSLSQLKPDGYTVSKLNLWFSSQLQATQYVEVNGGRVLCYGRQAIVILDGMQEGDCS